MVPDPSKELSDAIAPWAKSSSPYYKQTLESLAKHFKVKLSTKIFISARNKKIANGLKKRFKRIFIEKDNQKIIDNSNWVFLAVTPTVGEKIIKNLKFRSNQTIVSFISTIAIPELKKMIKIKAIIVRAIPLPPISLKKGPIPICPPNKKVKNFFNKIGSTIEIKNENLSINFWSTSGIMSSYYEILKVEINKKIKKPVKLLFLKA